MRQIDIQEEIDAIAAELKKELENLVSSTKSAINNVDKGSFYRVEDLAIMSKAEKIVRMNEKLMLLEKLQKQGD